MWGEELEIPVSKLVLDVQPGAVTSRFVRDTGGAAGGLCAESQGTAKGHDSLAFCGSAAYFQLLKFSPPLLFLILLDFLPTLQYYISIYRQCA